MSYRVLLTIVVAGFYIGVAFVVYAIWLNWMGGLLGAIGAGAIAMSVAAYREIR